MRARVRPDGAADRARDREPELEPGEAGRACVSVARRAIGTPDSATARGGSAAASTRSPSARFWTTRPRMPASLMTTLLPRPRIVSGKPRVRANFARPRSSKALCATANRSAGPPTRIVVNRASGSSREVLTPSRRWISPPSGERVEDGRAAVGALRRRRSRGHPRAALDRLGGSGSGRRSAAPRTSSATAAAAPGRPSERDAALIRAWTRRVLEDRGRVEQRRGVERVVLDQPRAAGLDEHSRVGALVARRVRVRAPRRSAGRSAVTSASVDDPARPTTRSAAARARSMSSRRNGCGR